MLASRRPYDEVELAPSGIDSPYPYASVDGDWTLVVSWLPARGSVISAMQPCVDLLFRIFKHVWICYFGYATVCADAL